MSDQEKLTPPNEDFYVVGVGASAGGLEALEKFITQIDSNTAMAFVIVQHLSPDYKSLMVEILSKHTEMDVLRAEDGLLVEKNKVYLIPPKKNLTIFHGKLYLTDQKLHHGINLPIDIFFRSLADDFNDRAIGVVLSGTGSDGTLGVRAIKGAGGMVMAQDEESAKFDGMPRSAIATGMVDFILPPEEMGEHLLKYTNHPLAKQNKDSSHNKKNETSYSKILSYIKLNSGTDFTYYKPNTIIRRIERRISIHHLDSINEYVDYIAESPHEAKILYKELLIGVTKFFRDTDAFTIIKDKVIPNIIGKANNDDILRFWVVGCSTGEEAYSLAILIQEYLDEIDKHADIKIFATDLDKESIEIASAGIYPESIIADVSPERLQRYFFKNGSVFKVNEKIRQMVIFATHNIIKDPPFSKIDFISCRNLLIYLEPYMQKRVISAFSFSLNKGAFLFLGNSESLGDLSESFSSVDIKWKIYKNLRSEKRPVLDDYRLSNMQREPVRQTREIDKHRKINNLQNDIIDRLFENFVPPSVVIDSKYNVIHTFNDVNDFLKLPKGKTNLNLMNMVPDDLSIPLSTSIHKVFKEKDEVKYTGINFKIGNMVQRINLIIKPIKNSDNFLIENVIVVFEKISKKVSEDYTKFEIDKSQTIRVGDLEQELKYTKENLQATIEELETSNEELQATNEELIASNEELQSTNEELQSVNEELYTVNSEYQQKIEELTELNNDINNWFKTSQISTIFLDLKLRVRKYTPEINRYVNLIQSDIGRPFKHISYNFELDRFFEKIESVLDTLQEISEEVQIRNNKWVNIRILPYRTTENSVKGVVITFIDITDLKGQELKILSERDLLERILENNPIANVLVDTDGIIRFVNKKATEVFNMTTDEMVGLKFNSKDWNVTDETGKSIPDEERPFSVIKNTGKSVKNMKEYINDETGKKHEIIISGSPDFDQNKNVAGAVFAIEINEL